jgi:hypothetical protein
MWFLLRNFVHLRLRICLFQEVIMPRIGMMTFHLPVTVQRQSASFVFVVNFMEPDHMTGAIFHFCEIPPP